MQESKVPTDGQKEPPTVINLIQAAQPSDVKQE